TRSKRDWSSDVCSSDLISFDSVNWPSSWPVRRTRSMEDSKDHRPDSCGIHKDWEKLLVGAVARPAFANRGASCERSGGAFETRRSEERRVGRECGCGRV